MLWRFYALLCGEYRVKKNTQWKVWMMSLESCWFHINGSVLLSQRNKDSELRLGSMGSLSKVYWRRGARLQLDMFSTRKIFKSERKSTWGAIFLNRLCLFSMNSHIKMLEGFVHSEYHIHFPHCWHHKSGLQFVMQLLISI